MRCTMPLFVAFALTAAGCHSAVGDGPVVVVTASYPGANAQVVADTVAAPIEQQINGVESMARLESESRNDGTYIAYVRFRPDTDPDLVVVLVQNRVALANPVLPQAVQRAGVAVKALAAEHTEKRVTIALVDRGGRGWDALGRFCEAAQKRLLADGAIVKPEVFPGPNEKQVRLQIDRAQCAALGVSVGEVSEAVQAAGAGQKVDALKSLRIRSANGGAISLDTLATFDVVSGPAGVYRVDLYPAVRIAGSPPEGKTAASAASRCAELADAERKSQDHAAGFAVMNLTVR
jgi:multidrug efflux pump subunit AcrB